MRYGITGTRHLREQDYDWIDMVLDDLGVGRQPWADSLIVGGCVGVDAYVARWACGYGEIWVHAVIPANRKLVDPDWMSFCHSHYEMPAGSSYRERDQHIVDGCDYLVGFPQFTERDPRSKHSGSWLTIRLAKLAGRPMTYQVLNLDGAGLNRVRS